MVGCGSLECVAEGTEEETAAEQVEAETAEEAVAAATAVGAKAAVAVAMAAETVAAETVEGRLVEQMGEEARGQGGTERERRVAVRALAAVATGLAVVVMVLAEVARALMEAAKALVGAAMVLHCFKGFALSGRVLYGFPRLRVACALTTTFSLTLYVVASLVNHLSPDFPCDPRQHADDQPPDCTTSWIHAPQRYLFCTTAFVLVVPELLTTAVLLQQGRHHPSRRRGGCRPLHPSH